MDEENSQPIGAAHEVCENCIKAAMWRKDRLFPHEENGVSTNLFQHLMSQAGTESRNPQSRERTDPQHKENQAVNPQSSERLRLRFQPAPKTQRQEAAAEPAESGAVCDTVLGRRRRRPMTHPHEQPGIQVVHMQVTWAWRGECFGV